MYTNSNDKKPQLNRIFIHKKKLEHPEQSKKKNRIIESIYFLLLKYECLSDLYSMFKFICLFRWLLNKNNNLKQKLI
jgi:hypothetical protein